MNINQTKEPITLYMVTEQDGDTTLYFHVGTNGSSMFPSWSKDISHASLFQTDDEALDQAAQYYSNPDAMTRLQSIKCYQHALGRSFDEDDTCFYLIFPERNCASLTRYIVYRERDGKEQYYHANDPRWKPIELYNDLSPEDACFGNLHSGYSDSILDTQLYYTYEGALSVAVAEGQGWKVREIVLPTHCVSRGSKQAPWEYLIMV
ncbi:MAG: hypothetical protein VB104_06710 [Candidatus Limiplasma sp.]|nr:hypothetical protein [Candidatus Limiplasma sp.]